MCVVLKSYLFVRLYSYFLNALKQLGANYLRRIFQVILSDFNFVYMQINLANCVSHLEYIDLEKNY